MRGGNGAMKRNDSSWAEALYRTLKDAGVRQVGYVPDAGHQRLIELCLADREMRAVVLSTEEEGVGLAAGARPGRGARPPLLRVRGVGEWVYQLRAVAASRIPLAIRGHTPAQAG